MFIVIEGVDRIGKSTQCKMLAERLPNVFLMSSPDRTLHTGRLIDAFLRKEINLAPDVIQLLFAANRREQQATIRAKLDEGKIVVCDRYIYSAIAYGVATGLDPKWCKKIDSALIEPDIVFYLWATDKHIATRQQDGERYSNIDTQIAVSKNFDQLIKKNWRMICAEMDRETIHEKIISYIDP
jgi:dTMP kinase